MSARKSSFTSAREIKVGVVGYGGAYNMGRIHLQQMRAAGMSVTAVAELDPKRLAIAANDFKGIETYDNLDHMLAKSEVDLITIITPHITHAQLALQCLRAGRHVICEKPFAISTREVDRMIAAAEKSGLLLSTYHNRHWDGRILLACDLVKRKQLIGDVVRIQASYGVYGSPGDWWRSSRTISGGILFDWGVHLLDYSLQLTDGAITEVTGFASSGFWADKTRWKEDTYEDDAHAIVRLDSGQHINLRISQIDPCIDTMLTVTGTKGTLLVGDKTTTHVAVKPKRKIITEYQHPPCQYQKYYNNICEYLLGQADLIITAEWARRPVHIIDLAMQSAAKGTALKAKYA